MFPVATLSLVALTGCPGQGRVVGPSPQVGVGSGTSGPSNEHPRAERTAKGFRWSDERGRHLSIELGPPDRERGLDLVIALKAGLEPDGIPVFDIIPSGAGLSEPAVVCIHLLPEATAWIPKDRQLRVVTSGNGERWEALARVDPPEPGSVCGVAPHLSLYTVVPESDAEALASADAAPAPEDASLPPGAESPLPEVGSTAPEATLPELTTEDLEPGATLPEKEFQIRPSKWFFERKDPKDFQVARPGSFADMSKFKRSNLEYAIRKPLEQVWARYNSINPLRIWSNTRARITAAYSPGEDRVLYRPTIGDEWPGFEPGMNVFIDMSSLLVAVSNQPAIMVGLRIVTVDPVAKRVVFRYLEGSPSYGEQEILFTASEEDPSVTNVAHRTWFRAYGDLIENMYPLYHEKMIDSMHQHFKAIIESVAQ